jgi:glycosyltransferase involved in cell wall biosynthesis
MPLYNLCIIKPNKGTVSETFITEHINRLAGNKRVLYGGSFPVYDHNGRYLIRSKIGLLSYIIQKRIFNRKNIGVRNRALVNYLKHEKIDVVFAEYGTVGAMVTQACKMAGIPLVVNFHGADIYQKDSYAEYHKYYKTMFAYASAIVAVSADMVEKLVDAGAPRNNVYWNPCGVDTGKFAPVDIEASGPYFLSVGRFVEKKSPQSVVKAFGLITRSVPDAHLWMVGTGPLFDETKDLAKTLGLSDRLTFTGALTSDKIIELFKQTRCFVQHSVTAPDGDQEGTPVTILEAGASGIPIVSTLHAGIKQAVVNHKTGYLVPEHDIEGMAAYMVKIAQDVQLAIRLGKAGREHMLSVYAIEKRIAVLDDVIQKSVK